MNEPRVSDEEVARLCMDEIGRDPDTGRGSVIPNLARDLRDCREAGRASRVPPDSERVVDLDAAVDALAGEEVKERTAPDWRAEVMAWRDCHDAANKGHSKAEGAYLFEALRIRSENEAIESEESEGGGDRATSGDDPVPAEPAVSGRVAGHRAEPAAPRVSDELVAYWAAQPKPGQLGSELLRDFALDLRDARCALSARSATPAENALRLLERMRVGDVVRCSACGCGTALIEGAPPLRERHKPDCFLAAALYGPASATPEGSRLREAAEEAISEMMGALCSISDWWGEDDLRESMFPEGSMREALSVGRAFLAGRSTEPGR